MKKVFALLVSILLVVTLAQAVTLTIIQPEGTVTTTRPAGSRVIFKSLVEGIKWWKVTEGNVEVEDGGFIMPNENVSVEAMYTGNLITVTQAEGGTITPGTVGVDVSASKTFTITPNSGYTVSDVLVDGTSVGARTSYEFTSVTAPHTITATFTLATYTITYNLDGGTVATANPTSYTSADAITLNNPTKEGYTFTGWTGTGLAEATTTVTIPTGSTGNRTYTADWTPTTYTITYNLDGGTVATANPTSYTIESNAITLNNPTKDGYNFTGWTGTGLTEAATTVTIPTGSTGDRTYTANWEVALIEPNADTSGANAPVLATGLTPVNWNGTAWETTTSANWKHNYNSVATATQTNVEGNGDSAWANAQTADGSLYVWIPRYTYKITSGEHSEGNSWNSLDAAGTNKIEVKFSNGTTDDTSNSYIKHPAFTFGADELQGIWVAKYEASQGSTTSELSAPTSSNSVAKSIPGVASWRSISVSNMFNYAYNTYRNADSHLMKNVEWGAVAYLTNAIGRIPYINNSSDYITGNAGGSQDAAVASGTTNAWNTANGVKASTTHNVYGIYDMSGGAYEYVAAYVNNGNSNLSSYARSLVNATSKYKDIYPVGSSDSSANNYAAWSNIKGDAVYETSNCDSDSTSWDGDSASAPYSSFPVFGRGGRSGSGSYAGVFCFGSSNGGGRSNYGFRVVLTGVEPVAEPNAPVLATGLTPVNWNGSSWTTTTEAEWDYNYNSVATATHSTVAGNGDGKWANAQTADGSLYVWIPRYTYKITSGEHQDVDSWNSLDTPGTGKIEVKFSNGTTDDTSNSYIKHPAFTFGSQELEGIWVAKYEASQGNTTSQVSAPTSSTSVAKSIPGVASWRNISVSNMFDYAYNTYRNADSHLMKNVEWGAVAYLTNAIGRIPYINNSSKYITGNAGGSQDAAGASGTTNAWNTANGVKASTTHNVYGIYDMSGGAWEYVAAYVNNGHSNLSSYASSLLNATSKYKDIYPVGSSDDDTANYAAWSNIKGDAVYETSSSGSGTTSWDGDYSIAPSPSNPVFLRGGYYPNRSYAGVFYFYNRNGDGGSSRGFRVVLTGVEPVTPTTYTITYNLDGGTIANPTSYTSEDTITLVNPTKEGYNFTGWTGTGLTEATTTVTIPTGSTGNRTYTANWEVAVTPANAPVLADGLTPVNWNGSAWETTTESNWDYNYNSVAEATHSTVAGNGDGKWANAQTADGSLYVWIPRYTYKITSGEHQDVDSWNSLDTPGTGKIEVKFSNGTTDDTSNSYIKHPAFTFGTDELQGIWVAKYEASQGSTTSELSAPTSSNSVAKSIPGVVSWGNISVSNMFDYAYNTYRNADSHLMKNTEWGAVAYLTNAIGRIPYINNSSSYITGNSGGSQDASSASGTTNAWNTANGVKASTTHNVYGIYDMSGGAFEYVAAYVNNGDSSLSSYASSLVNAASKYKDTYPVGSSDGQANTYAAWSNIKGDAVYETSNSSSDSTSWDGDYSNAPFSSGPVFVRGGRSSSDSSAGVFYFNNYDGSGYSSYGFRVVLTGVEPVAEPNAPVLATGLTPVNWNGSSWETTTESNWDYNYNSVAEATHSTVAGNGDGKWANAQTADGSLYVWIPRYTYKITSGEHQDVDSWNSLDTPGTGKIEVKFSNGTTDDTSNSYIKHPAFTFGTDELQGIWVAKYEASQGSTTSELSAPTSSNSVAKSIPGVASWRSIRVSNMFDYAYNTYRNADSHLMKNVEWGAVAYLTNAIGRIPYINNSKDYITGNAGGSQDAAYASGTTNAWNTANGVKASTTHNVYGIYDMSGGSWEYVAAYVNNGNSSLSSYASSLVNATSKYKDTYPVGSSDSQANNYAAWSNIKGDAVYETSSSSSGSTSWDGDYSLAPDSNVPVFGRGGSCISNSNAGVFYFNNNFGRANSAYGFRVVLTGVEPVTPTTYTITYNLDGGTIANPTSYTSEDTITLVNPTKDGYNFTGWTGTGLTEATTTVTIPTGSTGDRMYTANWEVAWPGWNEPVLATGLTPVNWNGSSWTTTTESSWDYNYNSVATATHSSVAGNGNGKWANAKTADGSLYVWIPRYTYKITSGEHQDVDSWNSLDTPGTGKIEVKFSNGTTDDTSNSYIKHPAFTFGTDELQGIWVAKYEASQGSTTSELSAPTSSNSVAKSIPGVASWREINVSDMFDYAYNTYRNADSHLMKNVEWGAVAYLTNAIGRIPYINNSSDYITGNAGGSQDAASASGTTNAWNTANGVKASTTHNVYGIYDMSGGAFEYVSAYYTRGSSTYLSEDTANKRYAGRLYEAANTSSLAKYVDTYATAYDSGKKGDAVYETSSSEGYTSWDGEYSDYPGSTHPVFERGGDCGNASRTGVFCFSAHTGGSYSDNGFRVVLGIR